MRSYDIDREELLEYYVRQKHSINECAEHFKTDYRHICTVLKGYGIIKNKPHINKKVKIFHDIDKEDFIRFYIIENHSKRETAKYFNCSKATIERFISKNNIRKTEEKILEISKKPIVYLVDKDELFEYYKTQKHTQVECAEYFNVPVYIIRNNLLRYGIESNELVLKVENPDDLINYYINDNHTLKETLAHFNISNTVVRSILDKRNIQKPKNKVSENRKKTCIDRFGCEFVSQTQENKDKVKQTCLEKFGSECALSNKDIREKIKQTNLTKYGVEYPPQNKEIAKKVVETTRRHCMEKYGVTCVAHKGRDKEFIDAVANRDGFRTYLNKNKLKTIKDISNSLELSCSVVRDYVNKYNSWDLIDTKLSQPEEEFYKYLCNKYGEDDIFREYNQDPRYPFKCDFYIKSIDTFVELNLFLTHGIKPYNSNDDECIALLELYKERAKTQSIYNSVINNWTVRDVLKLKTAQSNNLKYIMYYENDDLYDDRV